MFFVNYSTVVTEKITHDKLCKILEKINDFFLHLKNLDPEWDPDPHQNVPDPPHVCELIDYKTTVSRCFRGTYRLCQFPYGLLIQLSKRFSKLCLLAELFATLLKWQCHKIFWQLLFYESITLGPLINRQKWFN